MAAEAISTAEIIALIVAGVGVVIGGITLGVILYDRSPRLKIDHHLGTPPREWLLEGGFSPTPPQQPQATFRVVNTGKRTTLAGAYLALEDGRKIEPFSGGNPPMPSPLEPGSPRIFHQSLLGIAQALVNEGCKGTARVELIIRDGTGKLHREPFEISEVEVKAEGREA